VVREEAESLLRLSGKVDNPRERREKVSEEASKRDQEDSSPDPNEYERSETLPREQREQMKDDSTDGGSEPDGNDAEGQTVNEDSEGDGDGNRDAEPGEGTSTPEKELDDPNSLYYYGDESDEERACEIPFLYSEISLTFISNNE